MKTYKSKYRVSERGLFGTFTVYTVKNGQLREIAICKKESVAKRLAKTLNKKASLSK